MKAVVYERSVRRYIAANIASRFGRATSSYGTLRLRDVKEPKKPTDAWVTVHPVLSGICGSDLQAAGGRTAGYFEQITSFPFVLGHEIVGTLDDGSRVVIEPALGCEVRGYTELCPACASGHIGGCYKVQSGDISTGSQTGYCKSTGGGWSSSLVAHRSQIHQIPDDMTDEDAVLVEPLACAIHAVTAKAQTSGANVGVIGAGAIGLLVVCALTKLSDPRFVIASAKYPHQKALAQSLGAGLVVDPGQLVRAVRSYDESFLYDKTLLSRERISGGLDVVFDCIGSSESIAQALAVTRPGGRIVLVGMPANVTFDASPLWQREVEITGSYCYARSTLPSDFQTAIELAKNAGIGRLVSAKYPLTHWREALSHAQNAGKLGDTKVVFDLRTVSNA